MVRWSQGIALHFGHFYVAAEMARQDGALVTGYCSADWSLLRKQDGVLVTE
jgi:nicotinamide mononucleotide adenylyltransferase